MATASAKQESLLNSDNITDDMKKSSVEAELDVKDEEEANNLEEEEDYDEDDDGDEEEGKEFTIPQRFTRSGRKRATPFPLKLMKVLSEKKFVDIISWTPSGNSFNIIKPKVFTTDILPTYFKSAKYSSFTRKLHRWGFMRHYRGEEAGAFYHKCFQRGRMDLVEMMTCYKNEAPKTSTSTKKLTPAAMPAREVASRPVQSMNTILPQVPHITPMASRIQSFHTPLHSQSTTAVASSAPTTATPNDLNAAIEMEVNRRLKERINAAALNRQALLMQLQSKAQAQRLCDARMFAWDQNLSRPNNMVPGMFNPNVAAAAAAAATFKYEPTLGNIPLNFNNYADLSGFNSLPGSNIQGAKTA